VRAEGARLAAALLAAPLIAAAAPGPLDRIAAGESASVVLDSWCLAHGLPRLHAQRLAQRKAADRGVRLALRAGGNASIAFRRVRLACGGQTMSEADNWYLPSELTPDMNRRLAASDAPFGLVVRPLAFRRRTIATSNDHGRLVVRAVLVDRTGAPFSYVIERYAPLKRLGGRAPSLQ
jgi:hypothetical protein